MTATPKPVLLMVLDGWGYSENLDHNAIRNARTPNWDRLWSSYPHTLIDTSGAEVGLPAGQMGNSEVGHLNLGAGRIVYQEFTRVSRAVRTGSFRTNRTLTDAVDGVIAAGTALHIFGLLSPGGVHSHEEHLQAMVRMAVERGCRQVYLHAFLDGRDTPPRSAEPSLVAMQRVMDEIGGGRIATITGRYYAMDRDRRWERIQRAYQLLTEAKSDFVADDAVAGLRAAYARGEGDEFVAPTRIGAPATINDGDAVVFMNYRSDRTRQLTRTFIEPEFNEFPRGRIPKLSSFVSLTQYSPDFDIPVAFPPERPRNGFGEYISGLGLRQLRIAETEKYAHVTFFFNGGREVVFEGEDRILIPSPKVATYDLKPEMSARELTDRLVEAIGSGRYDAIVCNYANSDMVGHTGSYEAAILAIETLDACVERVVEALLKAGGEAIITADHGNAEQMIDRETKQTHTAHTSNPVPLIYVGDRPAELTEGGALCDVAPTLLTLMGLAVPSEMTGKPLVRLLGKG